MMAHLKKAREEGVPYLILLWLNTQADEANLATASLGEIQDAVGASPNTVRDALSALLADGDIEIEREAKGRRPRRFRIIREITIEPQQSAETIRQAEEEKVVAVQRTAQEPRVAHGVKAAFRATISNLDAFLAWLKAAGPRDTCVYHIGLMAADRQQSRELHRIASTASILSGTGYVILGQHTVSLAVGRQIAYTVTRTGAGYAPAALLAGDIEARDLQALIVLRNRPKDLSAQRALREGLAVPDVIADRIIADLDRRKLIETKGFGTGWTLTEQAKRMVV